MKVLPVVERVVPHHGPESGGTIIVVYGRHFTTSQLQVFIGSIPCTTTRRMSDSALQCLLPKGSGTNLLVQVKPCGCTSPFDTTLETVPFVTSRTIFSYNEATARLQAKANRNAASHLGNLHTRLNTERLSDPYEMRFFDTTVDQNSEFALLPAFLDLIPSSDAKMRFETCAVVSGGGSLAGSRSGPAIDASSAVFRVDNSPSAMRFSSDVGKRTTFQILNREWGETLLKRSDANGMPHVARWWLDVATVVLWHPASLRSFTSLRTLYPDATVLFLSPDFASSARHLFQKVKANLEETMKQSFFPNEGMMSSLLFAIFMALQTCAKVNVYGVLPLCESSSTFRCKRTSYFEDLEPTHDQQMRATFEEMLVLALEQAKLLKRQSLRQGDAAAAAGVNVTDGSTSAGSTICPTDCQGQIFFPHGIGSKCSCSACPCDSKLSETRCAGRCTLKDSAPALLKGVNVVFSGSLLMSSASIQLNTSAEHEADSFASLVEHDDSYWNDGRKGSLLPNDDSYMFSQYSDQLLRVWRSDISRYSVKSDKLASNISSRLGRCAAVGNSGALMNHRQGTEVDLHDVVYRFNQAPVDFYQAHVGSKTSHESLNSAWVKSSMESKKHSVSRQTWNWRKVDTTNVLFEMYDPAGLRSKTREQYAIKERWWRKAYFRLRSDMPDKKVLVLSPQFMAWAYELYLQLQQRFQELHFGEFRGEKPMSGFYAILFLLQVCDEVDIYGFTPYQEADRNTLLSDAYHYFDGATPRRGSHSFDLTRYIYELLDVAFPGRFKLHD